MKVEVEKNGVIKKVKVGFSWTILFFGIIPLLFRGLLLHSLIFFILFPITLGISWLVYAFIGNKLTIIRYLERGYKRTGGGWDYANQVWGLKNKSE